MIQFFKKSRGIKANMVLFFTLCAFLFPVSISVSTNLGASSSISPIEIQVATSVIHAQFNPLTTVINAVTGSSLSPVNIVTANPVSAATGGSWLAEKFFNVTLGVVIHTIGYVVMSVSAGFTYIAGNILELSLKYTVFEMGAMLNSAKLGNAIDTLWSVIRDICNLAFIFGFIYVGIRTIIDPDSANTKRFLSRIIIGALLINFSLFFVKIIVDFSNFTALQIYNAMMSGSSASITAVIADILGIATLYTVTDPGTLGNAFSQKGMLYYTMGTLLLLITAFVFVAGAIQFIIRFIGLIFIMIASPILFAATVFPQTEKYAQDLWKKLISYAIFAPAYLLLMLISITVLQSLDIKSVSSAMSTALLDGSSAVVFVNFAIAIGFMIGALTISSKLGIAGGDMTIKVAGAATFGLAARASRATIGRYAHNVSQREGLKDATNDKGVRGFAARAALKTSRAVGDSSFDTRNTGALSKKLGIGEGRKGGYTTVKKEIEKKEKEFAQSLGEIGDDDVRVQARKQEMNASEKRLRHLEQELRSIPNDGTQNSIDAKKRKSDEIATQKKAIEDAKLRYESEKQRRIIGSTYAKPVDQVAADAAKSDVTTLKGLVDQRWEVYTSLTDAQKELQRPIIQGLMKDLKEKKDAYAKMMREQDGGYAGILEDDSKKGHLASWISGRLNIYDTEAGKEMRKAAEKGLPKKKDE